MIGDPGPLEGVAFVLIIAVVVAVMLLLIGVSVECGIDRRCNADCYPKHGESINDECYCSNGDSWTRMK